MKTLVCKLCGEKFNDNSRLMIHYKQKHPKPKNVLTAGKLAAQYPQELEEILREGTTKSLMAHPEWHKMFFGRGEPRQILYTALDTLKKRAGKKPRAYNNMRGGPGNRTRWTEEQADLVRQIMAAPQWRKGGGQMVNWGLVFGLHPEWASSLNYTEKDRSWFLSFVSRVRNGKVSFQKAEDQTLAVSTRAPEPEQIHAEPVNGAVVNSVQIGGREYSLLELEQIIRAAATALKPIKWCPECGYSLIMHTKAYSIAVKHSQTE
jgi:hypothetical protein